MNNFWCFPVIGSLFLVIVYLTQAHWLAILLVLFYVVRLLFTGRRTIFLWTFFIGVVTLGITVTTEKNNYTKLTQQETAFIVEINPNDMQLDGDQLQFYGEVMKVKQNGTSATLKEKIVGFYRLKNEKEKEKWQNNQDYLKIDVIGELEKPDDNRNFAQFNYKVFLEQKKIHWILNVSDFKQVHPIQPSLFQPLKRFTLLRQKILRHSSEIPNNKVSSYIMALILGSGNELNEGTRKHFAKLGLVHLLSISGFHIQHLITLFRNVFLRIGCSQEFVHELLLIFLPVYGAVAGWQTGVFRAIVMGWILIFAKKFQLSLSGLDALSITTILCLWINPYQIFSVGFQLSYLLTFMILLTSKQIQKEIPSFIGKELILSFLMLVTSIPILTYSFYEFSWIVLLTTFLFTPIFSSFLLPSLVAALAGSFIFREQFIFKEFLRLIDFGIYWLEKGMEQLNEFGSFMIITGRPKLLFMVGFILTSILFVLAFETKKRRKRNCLVLALSFLFLNYGMKIELIGKVVIIDVGQGDAILIKEPLGRGAYLIDTGGSLNFKKASWQVRKKNTSVATMQLIPTLKAEGISKLKAVFITHGDEDHAGSLIELAEEIKIESLIYAKGAEDKAVLKHAIFQLKKQGVEIQEVLAGDRWQPSNTLSLNVLYPIQKGKEENNDSLVLHGRIGGRTWLFTGDIEEAGELEFLKMYPDLTVDCLKIAHHGSKTSTNELLLKQLKPKIALISCGLKNRFGHPDPTVLERLEKQNILVYRTDLEGAIHYRYQNESGVFSTLLN